MRVGVFICHCGINIASVVDVERVAKEIEKHPDVVYVTTYKYMCSDPGQELIKREIKEHQLDAVVVAACSPHMHEKTFRDAAKEAALNPYRVEIANIREHVSWVHEDREKATKKAIKIVRSVVEKVIRDVPLEPISVDVTRRCLVIGGGIAGIQAALDVAEAGYEVILVEKGPSIGGHMAQLSETFPTLDCSQCILTPKMVAVSRHPRIKILTLSEVEEVTGYVGNFHVVIKRKPRFVDENLCTACGDCEKVCPVFVPNEFDMGLSLRRAIYIPFPQAVPSSYVIDINSCLGLEPLICGKCAEKCEANAINYDDKGGRIEVDVGAIIVATGYELYGKENFPEYGYGQYEDVVTGLEFERLLSATGPTGGELRRPSDWKVPKTVVFIQCVGSRDPDNHKPYCSKICCMYTAKHAMLYKHRVPDGKAYIFYIDIRAGGKDYEEFVHRAMEEERITYIRGRVSKVFREGDKLVVWGVDTLAGKKVEVHADMVVLATAIVPSEGTRDVAEKLKCATDENGFLKEAHPKLRPVESLNTGVYYCGVAQGPKDIPETVAQASAAAAKAIDILSQPKLYHEPTVAVVDGDKCTGCKTCVSICPFNAIRFNEELKRAEVNSALCEGCGSCAVACPSGAITATNIRDDQVIEMVKSVLQEA
ncbi:MAG: disulfide reductase [Thermoplasmata archaeon]|nr:MAG: disulfide reductase [Thermoplasmata archaeon]